MANGGLVPSVHLCDEVVEEGHVAHGGVGQRVERAGEDRG